LRTLILEEPVEKGIALDELPWSWEPDAPHRFGASLAELHELAADPMVAGALLLNEAITRASETAWWNGLPLARDLIVRAREGRRALVLGGPPLSRLALHASGLAILDPVFVRVGDAAQDLAILTVRLLAAGWGARAVLDVLAGYEERRELGPRDRDRLHRWLGAAALSELGRGQGAAWRRLGERLLFDPGLVLEDILPELAGDAQGGGPSLAPRRPCQLRVCWTTDGSTTSTHVGPAGPVASSIHQS
jgi:hypothetical protein